MTAVLRMYEESAAAWTVEHRELRDWLDTMGISPGEGAYPGWLVTDELVEDADGVPAGVVTSRSPTLGSAPPANWYGMGASGRESG
jgi:hypothetical protein